MKRFMTFVGLFMGLSQQAMAYFVSHSPGTFLKLKEQTTDSVSVNGPCNEPIHAIDSEIELSEDVINALKDLDPKSNFYEEEVEVDLSFLDPFIRECGSDELVAAPWNGEGKRVR